MYQRGSITAPTATRFNPTWHAVSRRSLCAGLADISIAITHASLARFRSWTHNAGTSVKKPYPSPRTVPATAAALPRVLICIFSLRMWLNAIHDNDVVRENLSWRAS